MKTLILFAMAAVLEAQTFPVTPQVTTKSGRKYYSLPDTKGVVAAAQANLAADPKNPALMFKVAQAQVSVWQDREAVETLTRALSKSPNNAEYLTERGHRYLPLREFTKARADLKKAVGLDPKNMAAFYHLGLAHYFLNEFALAADAFAAAVATAPNNDERINSTNWLYAARRRAGKPTEAEKALEAVPAQMTNESAHTKHYLNLVRFFQGSMTEAAALPPMPGPENTDQEEELPFDTVAYGIGNWYLSDGQTAKAQDYFRRVLLGHVWVTWGFIGSELEGR